MDREPAREGAWSAQEQPLAGRSWHLGPPLAALGHRGVAGQYQVRELLCKQADDIQLSATHSKRWYKHTPG